MIAIDLDNTIICYDDAFRAAAEELDCLPVSGPVDKTSVKNSAIAKGGNDLWTRLQGLAYGEKIHLATLFPACAEFVEASREELVIVSHKTRFPAMGKATDLRETALAVAFSNPAGPHPSSLPRHPGRKSRQNCSAVAASNDRRSPRSFSNLRIPAQHTLHPVRPHKHPPRLERHSSHPILAPSPLLTLHFHPSFSFSLLPFTFLFTFPSPLLRRKRVARRTR